MDKKSSANGLSEVSPPHKSDFSRTQRHYAGSVISQHFPLNSCKGPHIITWHTYVDWKLCSMAESSRSQTPIFCGSSICCSIRLTWDLRRVLHLFTPVTRFLHLSLEKSMLWRKMIFYRLRFEVCTGLKIQPRTRKHLLNSNPHPHLPIKNKV
jgi:hypothetical protein